jgi:hypothetical protein
MFRVLHSLIAACRANKLNKLANSIFEAGQASVKECIEKLDAAYAVCMGKDKTGRIPFLVNSLLLESADYMAPMKEFVCDFWGEVDV